MAVPLSITNYTCGDTVTIIATNRPIVDFSTQPDLNDYKWAKEARITIYNELNDIVVDDIMCQIPNKPGHYLYRYKTNCDCRNYGIFRVVISMINEVDYLCNAPSTTGNPSLSGSPISGSPISGSPISGSPTKYVCEDVAVYYFRINGRV